MARKEEKRERSKKQTIVEDGASPVSSQNRQAEPVSQQDKQEETNKKLAKIEEAANKQLEAELQMIELMKTTSQGGGAVFVGGT